MTKPMTTIDGFASARSMLAAFFVFLNHSPRWNSFVVLASQLLTPANLSLQFWDKMIYSHLLYKRATAVFDHVNGTHL